jgi:hypothetical protein
MHLHRTHDIYRLVHGHHVKQGKKGQTKCRLKTKIQVLRHVNITCRREYKEGRREYKECKEGRKEGMEEREGRKGTKEGYEGRVGRRKKGKDEW